MKHFSIKLILITILGVCILKSRNCQENVNETLRCKVISVTPNTLDDLNLLKSLYDDYIPGIEFWSEPSPLMTDVQIQVCQNSAKNLTAILRDNQMTPTINIDDLQSAIEAEMAELEIQGRFYKSNGFANFLLSQYHRPEEINDFLELAVKDYPDKVSVTKIGRTAENRNLTIVKVGTASKSIKPSIFITSGLHAREWISVATAVYMIHKLTVTNDVDTQQLLQMYDWYFLPMANPDGYAYTWSRGESISGSGSGSARDFYHPRLWRKNRSASRRSICLGVDLNRNFDVDFTGSKSSSQSPCSSVHRGMHAFSERETQAIKNYVTALKQNLVAFIDLHSYGQMWMTPFGYKDEKPNQHDQMMEIANLAVQSLQKLNGTKYKVGTIIDVVYGTSGSSVDWVHQALRVKYAYALELRDLGRKGFLLSSDEIIPTANEIYVALTKMATEIASREINNLDLNFKNV